jgi:hypothetical protein
MTITITRKDWNPKVRHQDVFGCLLCRAVRRTLKVRDVRVYYGKVCVFKGGKRIGMFIYMMSEELLERAHVNPKSLPLKVILRRLNSPKQFLNRKKP